MTDGDLLLVEDDGAVRHIRLNRPEKLNAIDPLQHERIGRAFLDADADHGVRAIAFSGVGRAFCAGDDLGADSKSWPDRMRNRLVDLDLGLGPALLLQTAGWVRHVGKPTVALLHGAALGSGYDYSLSCDFRLATADVNYGDPRIHRAMWAAEGWSYKLVRQVDQSAVTPIAYLGERMDGASAYEYGLVHRVYPAGSDLLEEARPFLAALAALDPDAYRETKRAILAGVDLPFEASLP
ncbi:MAG: enoyl-CoA hydratase/isomerase family protein [Gammaproteobacteria bacterium]|nr:enoyl-CoA hydratase/isomerase family protein [Gammaproteobacteria bacterium]